MLGGGAAPASVGEAPSSGARARRHLGPHRRDVAGDAVGRQRHGAARGLLGMPAVAAALGCWRREPGDLRGVGLEERSPQHP